MKREKKSKKCDFSETALPILIKKIYVVDTIRKSRNKNLKKFRTKKSLKKMFEFFKIFVESDILELRGLHFHKSIFTVSCLTYIFPKVIEVVRHS